MNFAHKEAAIFRVIRWRATWRLVLVKFFLMLALFLSLALLGVFAEGVFRSFYPRFILQHILGAAILSFLAAIFLSEINMFLNSPFLRRPKVNVPLEVFLRDVDNFNLADFLDEEAALAVERVIKNKHTEKADGALLAALLGEGNKEVDFILGRAELPRIILQQELKKYLALVTPLFFSLEEILLEAAKTAKVRGGNIVGVGDILSVLAAKSAFFQGFLIGYDLKKEDLEDLSSYYQRLMMLWGDGKRFWEMSNLLKRGSIARGWAAGYTITLDKYSVDLVEKFRRGGFRKVIGHEKEIAECERILEKTTKNNVLIVGEPGTGRGAIIEAIAQKSFFGQGVPAVNYKRFLRFDVAALAATVTSFEEAEVVLDTCFAEAVRAGNVVLVIDNFHNFVSNEPKAGQINILGILGRYLPLSSFKFIAVTSFDGLHQIIERNSSLLEQLDKVGVEEISPKETMLLLEDYFVPFFERKRKKFIGHKALREIIRMSSRYLAQTPFPDKAVKLLDEAVTYLRLHTKEFVLQPKHIRRIITDKTQIPLEELEVKEKETLLNMEELMHQRVIGQEEAVREVCSALRRARAEVKTKIGPIGTFLFLGPTGVGKTETAKALAALYFGSEQRIIRLDMNEFQNPNDIKRLLGGQDEQGLLTTPARERPFSLVLLDELEKAHLNILNLFLQLLDEGYITDGFGRKVDFQNTIIIATSNAGAEMIREDIIENQGLNILKANLIDRLMRDGIFRPEFLNRFDAIVVFSPLSKENLLAIAQLALRKLARNLDDKGINLEITKEAKEEIVRLSYNPAFGAREMKRVVQDKLENVLAEALLSGRIKRGNRIQFNGALELVILESSQ